MPTLREQELREGWRKFRGRYDGLEELEADEIADFFLTKRRQELEEIEKKVEEIKEKILRFIPDPIERK